VAAMLQVALTLLVMVAAGAWLVAAWNAIAALRLAQKGDKLATLSDMHSMNFARIGERSGPAALVPCNRYAYAFIVFFGCVIAAAVIGVAFKLQSGPAA